jgi:protein involved in polysaccharide export with SLBB domain
MNCVPFSRTLAFLFAVLVVFSTMFSPGPARAADAVGDTGGDYSPDYKVIPGDILIIAVVGEKELTQDCRVSSSGTITYAWLSNVEVAGKSPADVEQHLRKLLDKDYLVDPTVLVAVKEYKTREVTVIGQVNKPGSILISPEQPMTIVDAVSRAGGFTRGADQSKIYFKRPGEEKRTFRWEELTKETDPKKTIYVQPRDVIEVKEKLI